MAQHNQSSIKSLGQIMFVGISGYYLTEEEKKFLIENDIGGVVLFSRNIQNPKQVFELTQQIQGLSSQTVSQAPFWIAIDMEGGRVARLKAPFTVWPPLKNLGDIDSPNLSFHFANAMGKELNSVGINLDFAPCIDVFTNKKNTVIGDRAVSHDAERVAKHAQALIEGYHKAGVLSCIKHYPGHGDTVVDSHEDLPREKRTWDQLLDRELVPFKKAFKGGAQLLMTAHIMFENIDPEWPVTLSSKFLKRYLREDLRFAGLVISDDLDMKALASHYDKRKIPVKALLAGCDLLLYCNEPESPPLALQAIVDAVSRSELSSFQIEELITQSLRLKKEFLRDSPAVTWAEAQKIIGSSEHQKIAEAIKSQKVPLSLPKLF